MNEIFLELAKMSPIIGILGYFLWYFKSELEHKNKELKELKELNTLLRDLQREGLNTMTKLTTVIEDLRNLIKKQFDK